MSVVSRPRSCLTYPSGLLALTFLTFVLWGCAVRLVSDYDEVIDRSATDLQMKVAAFLGRMEATPGTSEGEYANNRVFYEQARAALGAMRFRAQASPGGEPTVQHLAELEKQIENLRRLHERRGQAGLTRAAIDPIRTAINAELKAIVALELARKRGR